MDNVQTNHLEVKRTARYYQYGDVTKDTTDIIFAFHGYGQLGSYFAPKFSFLANSNTVVIVPEALSRFYLNGKYERVGASWITKEDTESEINDMLTYLNTLWSTLKIGKDVRLHLFGFSQGCATVLRWLNQLTTKAASVVLWAGYFAKGVEDMATKETLNDCSKYYVYGNKDEFLLSSPKLAAAMKIELKSLNFEIIEFEGSHKTPIEELKRVYKRILD